MCNPDGVDNVQHLVKKFIRVGAGVGFYGDAWEPVLASIERGGVQYIASDHLDELTLAIFQKDLQRDVSLGCARDVVPMLMRLWPAMAQRKVRFICNAGGLNPAGAAAAVPAAFAEKGWKARVAVVTGDEVLQQVKDLAPAHMFKAGSFDLVRERMVFANAYLGARLIVSALELGADIVITGRVADAALFLGPLVHEFNWNLGDGEAAVAQDLNRLAQGLAVGHLLECLGQGSGGNFGSLQAPAHEGAQDAAAQGGLHLGHSSLINAAGRMKNHCAR